jgi:hypothetical protein
LSTFTVAKQPQLEGDVYHEFWHKQSLLRKEVRVEAIEARPFKSLP